MKRLVLLALVAITVCGCVPRMPQATPRELPASPLAASLARTCRPDRTGMVLRHTVRLRIPGRKLDQTFSGLMRFDGTGRTVRAIGMGGFGLKLFDLTVLPEGFETHFMHPGLGRMPGTAEHIAFCVRRIWLDPQPSGQDGFRQEGTSVFLCEKHGGTTIEHEFHGGALTATRALGPEEYWEISYPDRTADGREPRNIIFTDGKGRYDLHIRLVETREARQ